VGVILQSFDPARPPGTFVREGPATQGFENARQPKGEWRKEDVNETQTSPNKEGPFFICVICDRVKIELQAVRSLGTGSHIFDLMGFEHVVEGWHNLPFDLDLVS
jgi:hypothetical protein